MNEYRMNYRCSLCAHVIAEVYTDKTWRNTYTLWVTIGNLNGKWNTNPWNENRNRVFLEADSGIVLLLGYDRFLPFPFQFIIILVASYYPMLCSLDTENIVKQLTKIIVLLKIRIKQWSQNRQCCLLYKMFKKKKKKVMMSPVWRLWSPRSSYLGLLFLRYFPIINLRRHVISTSRLAATQNTLMSF